MPLQAPAVTLATPDAQIVQARGAGGEFGRRLGRRLKSGAPVRNLFVGTDTAVLPPLANLLRGGQSGDGEDQVERRGGGRGGQLRVKLYLSLLWVCAAEPYEATYPARAWAALLGLEDHETKGVRRIHQAIRDLADQGMITAQDRGGHPSTLRLLDDTGSRQPYEPPSEAYNRLSQAHADPDLLRLHYYFRVPSRIWTEGYMPQLSGPGIAMLLVLLSQQRGAQRVPEVWLAPNEADRRFRLAAATRSKGLQELRDLGLITTRKKIVSQDGSYITFQRRRNVHTVTL